MIRILFILCGCCWIAAGLAAGVFGCMSLVAGGDNLPAFIRFLQPVPPGDIFLGLVHFLGFGVLAAFCALIGLGLCSGFFESGRKP